MSRTISVVRRRSHLVDLTVRRRDGVIGFRFSAASNFDASFTAFQTVPNAGYRSPSVVEGGTVGSPFRDQVRFLFDPSDYTTAVPAVRDDTPFYLRVEAQNPDGSFQAPEAMHLLLPYDPGPQRTVILRGNAPTGSVLTMSREIQLPMLCDDFEIRNQSTGTFRLNVAFERGAANGPEIALAPGGSIKQIRTTIYQLFIRGEAGSAAELYAILTLRNGPSDP